MMPAPKVPALITRWRSFLDISGTSVETTWDDLFLQLKTPGPYRGDREHPGWSPALCDPPLRKDENVRTLSALVLDCDGGASIEGARELWRRFYGLIHTTRKHSEAIHRFRIVLPLSRYVTPPEHARLWAWANARAVRASHRLDAATRNPSRFWYLPGILEGGIFEAHELLGEPVDVDSVLDELRRNDEPPRPAPRPRETSIVVRIRRASHYIGKMDGAVSGQGGHQQTWKVALILTRGFELSEGIALDLMAREYNHRCQPPWSEREMIHKIRGAAKDGRVPSGYLLDEDSPDDWHTRVHASEDTYEDEERVAIQEAEFSPSPEPPKKPSPFKWLRVKEIFAPLPPTNWSVPGLQLCPGRPAMLAAYGASGKTIISQAMALAAASRHRVWGEFSVPKPRTVYHFDHEQGEHATRKRYQRLALGLGIHQDELEDRLRVTVFPSVYLNTRGSEDIYARECEGVDLVILDALRGATPGVDENDSKIRDCIDQLARVSEKTGTCFWILHHSGKPKDGHSDRRTVARGSSAIFDACGAVFTLEAKKKRPPRVSHEKPAAESEGGLVEDFHLGIEDVAIDGQPKAGVRVVYKTLEQVTEAYGDKPEDLESYCETVLSYIRGETRAGRPVAGKAACAKGSGVATGTAGAVVDTLIARRVIEDRPEGKRPRLWALR